MGSVGENNFYFGLKIKEINCLTNLEDALAKITEWSYSNILTIFGLLFNSVWIPSYRSGTVNSKSFVSKDFLRIKWNFELTVFELIVYFKHEMIGIWERFQRNFELSGTSN